MSTLNCADCGTRAEPGQAFCEACGAVLSWREKQGGDASPRAAEAVVGAAMLGTEDTTGRVARAGTATASRLGKSADGADDGPHPDDTPTPPVGTDVSPMEHPGPPRQREPSRAETDQESARRARELLVPVTEPAAPAEVPEAIAPTLPGRPAAARQQVRGPGQEADTEGGVPCRWCGIHNRPDRHYCARCAMPMVVEQRDDERLPWWRRLLDSSSREAPWAGDRPRLNRSFGHIMKWVALGLVAVLAIFLIVRIPDGVQAARDHFAKRAPVYPDSVDASRSFQDHGPELAFDTRSNTWWGPGVSHAGEGEWIEARFTNPTDLLDMVITPGVSARAADLNESALPRLLEVTVTRADGSEATHEVSLDQGAGGQLRKLRAKEVVQIRFTLVAAHGASQEKQVAIAEIEFFGRSTDGLF
ncbi:NADase-type glycan-binding domain-containing protein [Streptomyces xiamenensis]|jgi:hypothetical protein|uniref:NADase-type glycan-binding domain-containing protein n=1 Tax=Streptomyces xiamenensis TaxID=408015 RepID=UPI003D71560B